MDTYKQLQSTLQSTSTADLVHLCRKFNIPHSNVTKTVLVSRICDRYFNVKKYIKYTYLHQLGRAGKDGRTFLATDQDKRLVAIKIFSTKKGSTSIVREAKLQMVASAHGIAPKVYEYDGDGKYIVMEKMDVNLFDCFRQQDGALTREQQKALISLFKALDACKVFHGDPNPLNFMQKNGKWYVIDFGFAKPINDRTIPKYGKTPNMTYMPLGFKLKLTRIYDKCQLKYIDKYA
jgi:predicted Ser/Thr protein kinase